MNDFGYYQKIIENLQLVNSTQEENIQKAGKLMADAIAADRLISVYGGGGHTTLPVGEMFFRAGGLACVNPIMETGLSVFNQALKYLELERTVNYGSAIVKYYDLKKDDVLIIFHNIGINPATIDAAMEAKKNGVKIIAVSSSYWQEDIPADHFIRHPSKKNLFDFADVCINDFNPVGDATVIVPGMDTPIAPVSNIIDQERGQYGRAVYNADGESFREMRTELCLRGYQRQSLGGIVYCRAWSWCTNGQNTAFRLL